MENRERPIVIRDHRQKTMFRMDDAFVDEYARFCGVRALAVYACLCRHANREQECFPSITTIAKKLGTSRYTVMRGIQTLIDWNIITKERSRRANKTWLNNVYTLLDKSVWRKPSGNAAHGSPSGNTSPDQVAKNEEAKVENSHTKDSNTKETNGPTDNTGPQSEPVNNVDLFIFLFREVNPLCDALRFEQRQRSASERLLKLSTLEEWKAFFHKYLNLWKEDKYCPRVYSPVDLEKKLAKILGHARSKEAAKKDWEGRVVL